MENKEIFKTNFEYTWDEYKKMLMRNNQLYWYNVLVISSVEILIILLISIVLNYGIKSLILCCDVFILNLIIYKVKYETVIKNYYKRDKKKGLLAQNAETFFYNDYLVRKSNILEIKLEYKDIKEIIETDTNFYILSKSNIVIPISKSDLTNDNEEFIRNINSKIYKNKLKKSKVVQKEKLKYVSKTLNIFLFLSILCFFLAFYCVEYVAKDIPSSFTTEKMYILLLWLPIPLVSVMLGFIYKREINIVVGIIVSFFLFVFGIFNLVLPIGRVEYNLIKPYESILDISIPKGGNFIQNKREIYFDEDKENFVISEAYFDDENDKKIIISNIKDSLNWIEFNQDVVNKYGEIVPYHMRSEIVDGNYILIYNKLSGRYNEVIELIDENEMLVAFYYHEKNHIEIFEYKFK